MAQLARTSHCRGCGKQIAFIKTEKGKTMPVDPEPEYFIPAGGPNTYVMIDGSIKRGRKPDDGDKEESWIVYISHFATCPKADDFRKRGA